MLFKYKAKDKDGELVEDVIQASNKKEAVTLLKSDENQILTIQTMADKPTGIFSGSISVSEKAAFCRFMATMLRSGLPLPEAVDIIRQETQSKKMKTVLFDISFHIRKGETLSSVLQKYKNRL
jgi:type IV pilus assembly protein PilC